MVDVAKTRTSTFLSWSTLTSDAGGQHSNNNGNNNNGNIVALATRILPIACTHNSSTIPLQDGHDSHAAFLSTPTHV
jgi:hypothetical protein